MLASDFRILVLDHDVKHIEKTRRYMESQGYDAEFSTQPTEALELLQREKFHLVIFDTNTPGADDLNLVKEIKRLNGFIEVVIATDRIALSQILQAFKNGLSNCVYKTSDDPGALKGEIERASEKLNRARNALNFWARL